MAKLIALDVAILPPAEVSKRAVALSAGLPEGESKGLRLGAESLPHVTLTQHFVREEELELVYRAIDDVVRSRPPLRLHATGGSASGDTVWIAIEPSRALTDLHDALMHALRGLERPGGTASAFAGEDARLRDAVWVAEFRLKASFGSFTPHITLGHAAEPPHVEPFDFDATSVAACHLGRFCTCHHVLRDWTLTGAAGPARSSPPDTSSPSA